MGHNICAVVKSVSEGENYSATVIWHLGNFNTLFNFKFHIYIYKIKTILLQANFWNFIDIPPPLFLFFCQKRKRGWGISKDAHISKYKTENWKILKNTSIYQLCVRVKIPRIFELPELKSGKFNHFGPPFWVKPNLECLYGF